MTDAVVDIAKGSLEVLAVTWEGGDMTGHTVEVLDGAMESHQFVTAVWVDPTIGLMQVTVSDDLHLQSESRHSVMRLIKTAQGVPRATYEIGISLK